MPRRSTTALHQAAAVGDTALVADLLKARKRDVALTAQDVRGRTPVDVARDERRPDIAAMLTKAAGGTQADADAAWRKYEAGRASVEDNVRESDFVVDADRIASAKPWLTARGRLPATSVLVSEPNGVLYERVEGYADVRAGKRANAETEFLIGSITKQFVAVAILSLQDAGTLNVDDHLSRWFPDFPRANEVSLHHLLTHTSGLRNFSDELGALKRPPPKNDAEIIAVMAKQGYMFNPGERFHYCNSGYVLLGMVIERASGKSLCDYLRDKFFLPLGMHHTGMLDAAKLASKENIYGLVGYRESIWPAGLALASGSAYTSCDFAKKFDTSFLLWAAGAGAMHSTARDLVAWNEALFGSDLTDGKILSAASLKQALTAAVATDEMPRGWYGYGFKLGRSDEDLGDFGSDSISRICHSGGLPGFTANLFYVPSRRVSIAVLSNTLSGKRGANYVGTELQSIWTRQMMSGVHEEPSVDASVSEEQRSKFVGKYDFSADGFGLLTISQDKGTARLTATGIMVNSSALVPVSPTKLVSRHFHPVLSFELTSEGDTGHDVSVLLARRVSTGRQVMRGRRLAEKDMCSNYTTPWFKGGDRDLLSRCAGVFDYGYGGTVIRPGRFRGVLVASMKEVAHPLLFGLPLHHIGGSRFCISTQEPMATVEFAFEDDKNGNQLSSATHMTLCVPGELPRVIERIEEK
jgi:CubicO group peptidase (beta-lactamase class C family)